MNGPGDAAHLFRCECLDERAAEPPRGSDHQDWTWSLHSVSRSEGLVEDLAQTAQVDPEMQLAARFERGQCPEEKREDYTARLNEELGIIIRMGYAGYFLIVWDFIVWAKRQKIPVGPGRGSGAGSLVAYALGITDLDPLAYGLLFERFLNPGRKTMPDIDVDFCYERRDRVIEYIKERYGSDSVAQIITFGKMKAKLVIRDVGRALGLPLAEVDTIAKLIPDSLKMTIDS